MEQVEEQFFLRQWREFRGMTQDELAEEVDTSKGYLSQMERGDRPYNRKWLLKFATALHIRPDQLLGPPPHLSDKDSWSDANGNGEPAIPFDMRLMRECIKMAFQVAASRKNIENAAEEAADAALESYFTYFRLKAAEEHNAA